MLQGEGYTWGDLFAEYVNQSLVKPHCAAGKPCCDDPDICVCECPGCDCRYAETPET
jgi:hypothetical protein